MDKFIWKVKNLKFGQIYRMLFVLLFALLLFTLYNDILGINYFLNGFNKIFRSDFQIFCLDVGQASANLIVFPNDTAMIIDTGGQETAQDFVENVEYILQKNNISEIEYLVLTHPDEDHVGGAVELLSAFQVNNIIRPRVVSRAEKNPNSYRVVTTLVYTDVVNAILNEPNCDVSFEEDESFDFGVTIFAPEGDFYSQTNSYSPFIEVEYNEKSILFCGDAPSSREKEFLRQLEEKNLDLDVDVLVVGHHGSNSSSCKEFLTKVRAETAIISAQDSIHPHREVLERLTESGVKNIYVTKDVGTVGLTFSGDILIKTRSFIFDFPFFVVAVSCCVFFIITSSSFDKPFKKRIYLFKKR